MEKIIIRKKYIALRQQMNLKDVAIQSASIMNTLLQSDDYQKANSIFTYIGVKNEVETYELIESALSDHKKVAVPKIFGKGLMKFYYMSTLEELILNRFGLLEPIQQNEEAISDLHTLMIVPGVAFDRSLNRMGFGAGYYDRYLSAHQYSKAIALAYDFQMVSDFPAESWDIKMDAIITQKQIFN